MAIDGAEVDDRSALRRLRSTALLVALVITLGLIGAATLGIFLVVVTSLIDRALG